MRIQFFQRLLDLLCARVAVIRSDGEIALSSQLARRQLELEPGTRLEVLHREGERLLVRQPCTQQLHSATGLRWAAFEFVLFQAPPVGIDSELAVRHRMLTELCRQPRFQAALSAADRLALQSVLGSSRTSIQPAEQTKASRGWIRWI
ncbi:hypothetical protein [Marinobacterium aestuariivivens]|uniref:Uncharacterized protein n=1 Tax=Marinobacterium aestuariivivens TaxID=1698799 RepID=A0ABW1ZVW6_9GAMM